MSIDRYGLVVVTPIYEDTEASSQLFEALAASFPDQIYVIAVDDGSVKQPVSVHSLERAGLEGVVIKLRRNVGHQRAIAIGLGYASERVLPKHRIIVMDSDGEDQPSTIGELLATLDSKDFDVVVAQRKSRVETVRFKLFYAVYKIFFWAMTGRTINFGNFTALKSHAVKRLVAMQESSIHFAAAILASKLRVGSALLDRGSRYAGRSKMNFVGLVLHGFKGLMVFAEDVLVRVGIACALIAVLSVTGVLFAIVLKLLGFSTPGWFSVALGILVLMLLQTGALALMTLMLTGVVRGGTVSAVIAHHEFIDSVVETAPRDAVNA